MDRAEGYKQGLMVRPEQPLPDLYWQQCGRKIAHPTWIKAFTHAFTLAVDSPTPDRKMSVYCCPWGLHFHVGHKIVVDWSKYVTQRKYKDLIAQFNDLQKQMLAAHNDARFWQDKYNKKCQELAAERKSYVPRLITPVLRDPFPKTNKLLKKVKLKLTRG